MTTEIRNEAPKKHARYDDTFFELCYEDFLDLSKYPKRLR